MVCLFQAFVVITRSFKICYFVLAGLLDGSSDVARQFCHLILLRRLRSVTLRPTFSDGLPFSSSNKNTAMFIPQNHIIISV